MTPTSILSFEQQESLVNCFRCISDIQYDKLHLYPITRRDDSNKEHDIAYLMNKIDEIKWRSLLERGETSFERKKEIGLILQTIVHVGGEHFTQLVNGSVTGLQVLNEMKLVRSYTNQGLCLKGKQKSMSVPFITDDWNVISIRKENIAKVIEEEAAILARPVQLD